MNTAIASRALGASLAAALLAGCSVTPVYERPDVALPDAWDAAPTLVAAESTSAHADWWKRFGSAAEQARESYRLARVRYGNGAEDLLSLLDSQRSRLDAEDSLVQAEFARYEATATLFRALGGGWQDAAAERLAALPAAEVAAR